MINVTFNLIKSIIGQCEQLKFQLHNKDEVNQCPLEYARHLIFLANKVINILKLNKCLMCRTNLSAGFEEAKDILAISGQNQKAYVLLKFSIRTLLVFLPASCLKPKALFIYLLNNVFISVFFLPLNINISF